MSDFTSSETAPPKQGEQISSSRVFEIIDKVSNNVCEIVAVGTKAILLKEYWRFQLINKDMSQFTAHQITADDIKSDGWNVDVNQHGTQHNLKTIEAYNSYARKTASAVFNILDFFEAHDGAGRTSAEAQTSEAIAA